MTCRALLLGDLGDVEGDRGVHEDTGDEEGLAVETCPLGWLAFAGHVNSDRVKSGSDQVVRSQVVSGPCRGRRRRG
jgi:hypothetical protein